MNTLILLLFYNIHFINGDVCNGINGRYSVIEDKIELCVKSKGTTAHEMGHRFYRTKLTKKERQTWEKIYKKYNKPRYFISKYASTYPEEDFAVMFERIYSGYNFKYQHNIVKGKKLYILKLIKKYEK